MDKHNPLTGLYACCELLFRENPLYSKNRVSHEYKNINETDKSRYSNF